MPDIQCSAACSRYPREIGQRCIPPRWISVVALSTRWRREPVAHLSFMSRKLATEGYNTSVLTSDDGKKSRYAVWADPRRTQYSSRKPLSAPCACVSSRLPDPSTVRIIASAMPVDQTNPITGELSGQEMLKVRKPKNHQCQ